ncbi:phage portal protein family protein [Gemmata sp.]|uniref:phage portal protein family protein n=1 Tax=Gemmata sp. TaxID=1914242 RepID=UPI003F6ECA96
MGFWSGVRSVFGRSAADAPVPSHRAGGGVDLTRDAVFSDPLSMPWRGPLDLDNDGRETAAMRMLFREAYLKEPSVRAAVRDKANAIASLDFTVLNPDRRSAEAARATEWVKWSIQWSKRSTHGLIQDILTPAFVDGWSPLELTLRQIGDGTGPADTPEWEGLWGLKHARSLDSHWLRLTLDQHRNVTGVVNLVYGLQPYSPAKVLIYTHNGWHSNPFGQSDLRAVVRAVELIEDAYKAWYVAIKRCGMPYFHGKVKDGNKRKLLEGALKEIYAMGWAVTSSEDSIEVLNLASAASFQAFEAKVNKLREDVFLSVRGVYLPFLQGQGGGDARGSSAVHKSASDADEDVLAKDVAHFISLHVIPAIVRPNFGPQVKLPVAALGAANHAEIKQQLDAADTVLNKLRLPISKRQVHEVSRWLPGDASDPDDILNPPPLPGQPGPGAPGAPPGPGPGGGPPDPQPAPVPPEPAGPPGAPPALPPSAPQTMSAAPDGTFPATEAANFSQYFLASRHGHYPGDLHEQFGMGVGPFAAATRLMRKQARRGGASAWAWAERPEGPDAAAKRFSAADGDRPKEFSRPENYEKIKDLPGGAELWAGANDWEDAWTWAGIHGSGTSARDDDPVQWLHIDHANCPACRGTVEAPRKNRGECQEFAEDAVDRWLRKQKQGKTFSAAPAGGVVHLPTAQLVADPDRFQFRDGAAADGTVRALPGEPFDPAKCKELLAWRDPADGRDYVVDGHHRLAWAERDGVARVPARYVAAATAAEAKRVGERANAGRDRSFAAGGGVGTGSPDPDDAGALALALIDYAIAAREAGDDPAGGLDYIREHVDDPGLLSRFAGEPATFAAGSWNESDHPRGRGGHFIKKGDIEDAKTDPEKARQLREQVRPEDAAKLEAQLALPAKAPPASQQRAAARDRGAAVLARLAKAADLRAELTADDLHALADHLADPAVTVAHLREVRRTMRANALRAGFGGGAVKADMAAALVAHARAHAFEARLKEQGITGDAADEMRRAAGLLPKAVAVPEELPKPVAPKKEKPRKRKYQDTVINKVRDFGGIDPHSLALQAHYGSMKDAINDGVPLSVFKKGGRGLDQIAQELESSGYIRVPDGKDATEHVLDLIRDRAHTLAADLTERHEAALDTYYKEQQRAEAERLADPAEIAAVVRRGQESAQAEVAEGDLGEHGEGADQGSDDPRDYLDAAGEPGDAADDLSDGDDSFDFGANAPEVKRGVAKFKEAVDASPGLSPEQRQRYHAAVDRVAARLPAAAHTRLERHLESAHFHPDAESVGLGAAREVLRDPEIDDATQKEWLGYLAQMKRGELRVGGVYAPTVRSVHVDGDGGKDYPGRHGTGEMLAHHVYAHELGHAIDGPDNEISNSPQWRHAFGSEIQHDPDAGGEAPLTTYAGRSPSEGLAEFARLLYATDTPTAAIERDFPKAAFVFKGHGLWPTEREGGTGTGAPEVFDKPLPMKGAAHADALRPDAEAAFGGPAPPAAPAPARTQQQIADEITARRRGTQAGRTGADDAAPTDDEFEAASRPAAKPAAPPPAPAPAPAPAKPPAAPKPAPAAPTVPAADHVALGKQIEGFGPATKSSEFNTAMRAAAQLTKAQAAEVIRGLGRHVVGDPVRQLVHSIFDRHGAKLRNAVIYRPGSADHKRTSAFMDEPALSPEDVIGGRAAAPKPKPRTGPARPAPVGHVPPEKRPAAPATPAGRAVAATYANAAAATPADLAAAKGHLDAMPLGELQAVAAAIGHRPTSRTRAGLAAELFDRIHKRNGATIRRRLIDRQPPRPAG